MLVGLTAAGVITIMPKYLDYRKLIKRRDELQATIEHKKMAVALLREKQQRFKTDPDFVELVARSKNMVRPNEVVFVFEEEEPSQR